MSAKGLIAAIEGGGTHFNCALFDGRGQITAERQLATTTPEATIAACLRFFREAAGDVPITAAGLACFGPLNLDPESEDYGCVLDTPKPHWGGFNPRAAIADALRVNVAVETDVSGSAIGEWRAGAARDIDDFVYVTVGTGIGAAVIAGGKTLRGATHLELGHISIRRAPGDNYPGCCPFHGDCLSGLASGPAIAERWSAPGETLPAEHYAWVLEAHYLAELCRSVIYSFAPRRIVLGGGVMAAPGLLEKVRTELVEALGEYHCAFFGVGVGEHVLHEEPLKQRLERGLVLPQLGARSALVGAYHMAVDLP